MFLNRNYRGSTTRQFLYAPSGAKIARMNGQTLDTARVPLPGGAIADYHASGFNAYGHADWLGSTRFGSTATRTKDGDWAFAPFGEVYAGSPTSYTAFTGQTSDMGSNLWDFSFREYHSTQGRWISPDPAGLAAVNLTNPQTWNRYAYVGGNPLSAVDPSGLGPVLVSDGGFTLSMTVVLNDIGAPGVNLSDDGGGDTVVGTGSGCVQCNKSLTVRQDLGDKSEWWKAFVHSLFTQFSLKSARQPGESIAECVSRVRAAGGSFTTAVDAATPISLFTWGMTTSFGTTTVATGARISFKEIQIVQTPTPNLSLAEGLAANTGSSGLFGAVEAAAPVASKVSGVAAAVGAGLELGSVAACR